LEPIIDECSTLPEGLKIKVTKRKIDVLTNDGKTFDIHFLKRGHKALEE
jgi:hypothetical protein